MELTIDDMLLALEHEGMPKMLVKSMPKGFVLVPFETLLNKAYRKDYEPWQYAFVNKDKGMYKFVFSSFNDMLETLFNAKEICYGCYPQDAQPNPLCGKSLEYLKIENEMNICTCS